MTLLVGIHIGGGVLIAADNRVVALRDAEILGVVSDNECKIAEWSGGGFTGCGYVPFLDSIKHKVSTNEIKFNHQILDAVKDTLVEFEDCREPYWKERAYILFSYETTKGMRLGYSNMSAPEATYSVEPMRAVMFAPFGSTDDLANRVSWLNSEIKGLDSFVSGVDFIKYYVGTFRLLFSEISKILESVSPTFDLYYQDINQRGLIGRF